ncbi:MAG TPA: penicillin-binding transpeptidase domain-containing protein, partial [Phenylobacterium sp.]|nr:penicillin-binding transpeptidase domain-containing protein [Phenylobacterium sp.]
VGGEDYGRSQFNRAVQSRRQPGSSFKLFVYLAALRQGATPETLVADEPVAVGNWQPENASGRYQGLMTLRDAFAHSSNVAAVRVSESVGRGEVVRAARDLGISGPLKAVPSLALGANEVTLLDMTSAYAAVAAGAYPVTPTGLQGVAGSQPVVARRSLPEQGHLLALLNAAAEQGAGLGGALPYPVFGKTGTTQNNRDAWFIGFAGDLVVGVWVGNDDATPMVGVGGGGLPAQIWRAFMEQAVQGGSVGDGRAAPSFEAPGWSEEPSSGATD